MTTFTISCPTPISAREHITLAHGGGGRIMHGLIERLLVPAFSNPLLETRHDGAIFEVPAGRLAFTTDSYVVRPIFFPGGDIGTLAVNGTVNDLSMCGARPLYISCALILEEGFPIADLERVIASLRAAADAAGVHIVTGDTKVVDKGKGDGIFINTAGIGIIEHGLAIGPQNVREGDAVLLSGDIGRHSIAITAVREGIAFESKIESDCAPLWSVVKELLDAGLTVRCMRDLTRGGLASALIEISEVSATEVVIEERTIAVRDDVAGACEMLGFDPLYLANEGRFIVFVPAAEAAGALEVLRRHDPGSAVIGRVEKGRAGMVSMTTTIGTRRVVDMLSGEQLPRIC
jgi:hydrogenase expression/formation protein HypE